MKSLSTPGPMGFGNGRRQGGSQLAAGTEVLHLALLSGHFFIIGEGTKGRMMLREKGLVFRSGVRLARS